MPVVAEVYLMCTVAGALILLVSAVMGGLGHGHALHGHIGHAGGGQAGGHLGHAGAHGGAAGVGQGHSGAFRIGHGSQATAGHGGHSSAGTSGHAAARAAAPGAGRAVAPHAGSAHGGQGNAAESNAPASMGASSPQVAAVVGSHPDMAVTILTLLNPATISSFSVWFGACGLFAWRLMPFLPVNFTLPIALFGGFLGTKMTLTLMGLLVSRMYSSGSFTQDSLIGYEAEVTVGFTAQQTGEITCTTGGPRYTLSARCFNEMEVFKRSDRVIIADICDHIAFVQPLPDELKAWEPDSASGSAIEAAPKIEATDTIPDV